MHESSRSAPWEAPETAALKKELVKDFYFGFRFSQGRTGVQLDLYKALGAYYRSRFTPDELSRLAADDKLHSMMTSVSAPRSHRPGEDGTGINNLARVQAEFNKLAHWFNGLALRGSGLYDTVDGKGSVLYIIVLGTLSRDTHFQHPMIPRGYLATDPHASYFRDYILERQPTGSEAYDAV